MNAVSLTQTHNNNQAFQQDFFPLSFTSLEEASLVHNPANFGFFSILSRPHGKPTTQNSFRLTQMHEVLPLLPTDIDTWMSQCEFTRPNRRIINLARIPLLFVDLDCYTLSPQKALSTLLWRCDDIGLPQPSITIFSGRGLQAKWLLDRPLPPHALIRWNHVQSKLVESFEVLGADQNAKDASRVLRLVDTTNTKSNQRVQVLHVSKDNAGLPARYDFEYAAEILLPNSRDFYDKKKNNHPFTDSEKQAIADARIKRETHREAAGGLKLIQGTNTSRRHSFSGRQLAWHRVEDIRTLVKMRGGVRAKQSMQTLFMALNFLLLSGATNSSQMFHEAKALAHEFGFGEFNRADELSTLYAKAKDYEAGKTVTFNGREYPALYTPKNSTLIDMFEITDDEQKGLRTIISTDIAKERNALAHKEARHASGENKLTRDAYLSTNNSNRAKALEMRNEGMNIRTIASQLAVSVGTIHKWVK